jgi:hypothetical protein
MTLIESDYQSLKGMLPKNEYQELDNEVLGRLSSQPEKEMRPCQKNLPLPNPPFENARTRSAADSDCEFPFWRLRWPGRAR